MKINSLRSLKLLNNWVLVKPDPGNDQIRLKGGKVLYLHTYLEEHKHAVTSGTVVKCPPSLTYYTEKTSSSLDYETSQELKTGDKVIFHFLQTTSSVGKGRYIEYGDEIYLLIKYDSLFCALRNIGSVAEPVEAVIPVNGYVLVEPKMAAEYEINTTLILPDYLKKKSSEMRGIVRYIGSPLFGYRDYPEYGEDADNFQVGDDILFPKGDSVPLQYEMHRLFDKDKLYYRMHRRDILGKYKEIVKTIKSSYAFA